MMHTDVQLRLVRTSDVRTLETLLRHNRDWLSQWEATHPSQSASVMPTRENLRASVRSMLKAHKQGAMVPFVIELRGRVVGVLNVSGITRGALNSCTLGYWIAQEAAGKGVMPIAVAKATDYLFEVARLHRVEICIRPENQKSLRVVQKLGFRFEGNRERYIHIDGHWRDHACFALVNEDVPEGLLRRYLASAS